MSDTATMTPQQLMSAVRSRDPMHGLCEARQITKEGCDWLKFALDPFHDLQLDDLKGFPDVNTEPTVIVKVRQALEVSKPAGLPADSNWDCHITLSPIDWAKPTGTLDQTPGVTGYNATARVLPQGSDVGNPRPAGLVQQVGGSFNGHRNLTGRLDGLVINSVPASAANGGDLTYTPGHMPNVPTNGYATQNINLDQYLDFDDTDLGVYRLVYSGFEVVNTTAQIHKQGAVTVYEYGHSFETSQALAPWDNFDTAPQRVTTLESIATNTFRSPPNSIAEAKIMPGSHTWAAQDGCYCTAKFATVNPFQAATNRNYIVQQNMEKAGSDSGYGSTTGASEDMGSFVSPGFCGNTAGTISAPPGVAGYYAAPATHFSHMSTPGAYFTGLSPDSTLFVTWRVGLERLPAANKPTFLALAQPSATFDPNALLLYNLIANQLPPGCPQGWNDLGRWFSGIANVAKKVIPSAFPLISTAQMILDGFGKLRASSTPRANGGGAVASANGGGNTAAKRIQAAARKRQNSNPGGRKQAVQNFGQPGQRNGAPRVQSFSQMAKN